MDNRHLVNTSVNQILLYGVVSATDKFLPEM